VHENFPAFGASANFKTFIVMAVGSFSFDSTDTDLTENNESNTKTDLQS
jgi:hypothetical protein